MKTTLRLSAAAALVPLWLASGFAAHGVAGAQASPTIGSGTVNLTSMSGGLAGRFSLTLDPVPGTGASGSIAFGGAFNVRY